MNVKGDYSAAAYVLAFLVGFALLEWAVGRSSTDCTALYRSCVQSHQPDCNGLAVKCAKGKQ